MLTRRIYMTKAERPVAKQGHLQPRCHTKARSPSIQLRNGLLDELRPKQLYRKSLGITSFKRQFYFRMLRRILVTNNGLKRFRITDCDKCAAKMTLLNMPAFFQCQSLKLSDESFQWFNSLHKINLSLSDKQTKDLCLLVSCAPSQN